MHNDGFQFMKYCNEQLANTNDQRIAMVLLDHLSHIDEYSLEQAACDAMISTASVSRFVRNAGFASFKTFKSTMMRFQNDLRYHRSNAVIPRFYLKNSQELSQHLFADAAANLTSTIDHLDHHLLQLLCKKMLTAHRVIILGDSHEINDFYTVQLDLIAKGIPAFLINIFDQDNIILKSLHAGDLVLYLDLFKGWYRGVRENVIGQIRSSHADLFIFAQDTELFSDADQVMEYGVPESMNDGYYSLPLLNRILCQMLALET